MSRIIGGIDEAGRGCILGSLYVAGVAINEETGSILAGLGVKDSKMLSPAKREVLHPEIRRLARKAVVLKIEPAEMSPHSLNVLEEGRMAAIADELGADITYFDACDTDPGRFGKKLETLMKTKTTAVAEHHADANHVAVSAASVIAKVERDRALAGIARMAAEKGYSDIGSGYTSDPQTIGFLKAYIGFGEGFMDGEIRKSWKTWKRLSETLPPPP